MANGMDLVMLVDKGQLGTLALLLRNLEEDVVTQAATSEHERAAYLKNVNDSHDGVMNLLQLSTAMNDKYAVEGGHKAGIAADVLDYIKYGLNMSMQNIRDCSLRATSVGKIREHFDSVATQLAEIDPAADLPRVEQLAEDMANFKNSMWEYCNRYRSGSARALSKVYSMVLREEGITFPDLMRSKQNQLGFQGAFEDLTDAQKLEVYNSIIGDSGRAAIPKLDLASAALGVAVLLAAAGVMAWDIFTAEYKMDAVLHDSMTALSAVGAFAVQVSVEAAVTEAVVDLEAGVFIVSLAGYVSCVVGGIIIQAIGGLLIDLILGTGGNQAPPVTDLKFHTATMPDGMALANQIYSIRPKM